MKDDYHSTLGRVPTQADYATEAVKQQATLLEELNSRVCQTTSTLHDLRVMLETVGDRILGAVPRPASISKEEEMPMGMVNMIFYNLGAQVAVLEEIHDNVRRLQRL